MKNTSAIILAIFISLILIQNTGYATVSNSTDRITVTGSESYDIQRIYDELVSSLGSEAAAQQCLNETEDKVWVLKRKLTVLTTVKSFINSSQVRELKFDAPHTGYNDGIRGNISIDGVAIRGWNDTTQTYNRFTTYAPLAINGNVTNTQISGLQILKISPELTDTHLGDENLLLENLTLYWMRNGIELNANRIHANNITIRDGDPTFGFGFAGSQTNNSEISNIRLINISSYDIGATYAYGIHLSGNNNRIHDIYMNGVGYSATNLHGTNNTYYNFFMNHSGHNGFELEADECTIYNITMIGAKMHNIFQVGAGERGERVRGNTYINITSINPGSYGMMVGEGSANTQVINSYFNGTGMYISSATNVTCINQTTENGIGHGLYMNRLGTTFNFNDKHKIIDANFSSRINYDVRHNYGLNSVFLNIVYSTILFDAGNYTRDYYLQITTKDNENNPIGNAELTIESDIEDISSINSLGNTKSVFRTKPDGQTYLPNESRTNSPAISEYFRDKSTGYAYPNWTITARKLNGTATNSTEIIGNMPGTETTYNLIYPDGNITHYAEYIEGNITGIHPNISWYRQDPNIPAYTFEIILNQSKTSGNPVSWQLAPENDIITCTSATNTTITISTNTSNNPIWLNNTIPAYANKKLTLLRDSSYYRNTTADTNGSVSFYIDEEFTQHTYTLEQSKGDIIINVVNQIGGPVESVRLYINHTNGTNIETIDTYPGNFYHYFDERYQEYIYVDAGSHTFRDYSTEYDYTISIDEPDHTYNITDQFTTNPENTTYITLSTTDSHPPATIRNLINASTNITWIYWTWTNPSDYDYSKAEIWLNGTNIANTTNNRYNTTNLEEGTSYTISIRTVDDCGNINNTWVNYTASTRTEAEQIPSDANAIYFVENYYNTIVVSNTTIVNNIPRLYASLVERYNESFVQERLLNQTSNKIWLFKAKLKVEGTRLYINSTDTIEVRFAGRGPYGYHMEGNYQINNTILSSWNLTTGTYRSFSNDYDLIIHGNVTNTRFNSFQHIWFGFVTSHIDNINLENLHIERSGTMHIQGGDNIYIHNVTIENGDPTYGDGIEGTAYNSVISDIRIINVSNYTRPATGAYGLHIHGANNTIHDIFSNGTAWSTILFSGDNFTGYNMVIVNSGHNGFEVEANNSYFRNISVTSSAEKNFFIQGGGGTIYENITYVNISESDSHISDGFLIGQDARNIYIENATLSTKLIAYGVTNITFYNSHKIGGSSGIANGNNPGVISRNVKSIDSTIINNSYKDIWNLNGYDTKSINTNFTSRLVNNGYMTNNYYIDIQTLDNEENPLGNTEIIISTEFDKIKSIDGWGNNQTTFGTKSNGHTYLPNERRTESPAIGEYYLNSTTLTYINWTITARKANGTYTNDTYIYADIPGTENGYNKIYPDGNVEHRIQYIEGNRSSIRPNSSWYRQNPNTPVNTVNITLNQTRNRTHTSWTILPITSPITTTQATNTSVTLTSETANNPVWLNNTIPEFSSRLVGLMRNNTQYTNTTASENGTLSFYYNGSFSTWDFSLEILLYCGDSYCNNGETCSTCATDCGSCPSSSGSTGSSSSSSSSGGGAPALPPAPINETEEPESDNSITGDIIKTNTTTNDNNTAVIDQTHDTLDTTNDNPDMSQPKEKQNSIINYIILILIITATAILLKKRNQAKYIETEKVTPQEVNINQIQEQQQKLDELEQYIVTIKPIIESRIKENTLDPSYQTRIQSIEESIKKAKETEKADNSNSNEIETIIESLTKLKQEIEENE